MCDDNDLNGGVIGGFLVWETVEKEVSDNVRQVSKHLIWRISVSRLKF